MLEAISNKFFFFLPLCDKLSFKGSYFYLCTTWTSVLKISWKLKIISVFNIDFKPCGLNLTISVSFTSFNLVLIKSSVNLMTSSALMKEFTMYSQKKATFSTKDLWQKIFISTQNETTLERKTTSTFWLRHVHMRRPRKG